MKGLLITVALVASCTPPEEAVVEAGGKAPVRCLRPDDEHFTYCRDANRAIFVCKGGESSDCVSIDRVRAALGDVLEGVR